MRALRPRIRTIAGAGLLMTGALLATACQPDGTDADGHSSSKPSAGSSGKAPGGSSSKATNGTFSGTLKYISPGEYMVKHKTFNVAKTTEILGNGTICGTPNSYAPTKCTFSQLENAIKKGGVHAQVTVSKGNATRIAEQPKGGASGGSSGKATNGTFSGTLKYISPGEYMVKHKAFNTARNTEVVGNGHICGTPHTNTASKCTLDDLARAVQKGGIRAKVTISKGSATRIIDQT